MKTSFLTALVLLTTGLFHQHSASADHAHAAYRTYDDLAFSAHISARELRWEIHEDFVSSREYNHLLRDADQLLVHLRDLQRLIDREESVRTLSHHVNVVLHHVNDIRICLVQSDFALGGHRHGSPSHRHHNPNQVHVDVALQSLGQVESNLKSLSLSFSGRHVSPVITPFNGTSTFPSQGTPVQGPINNGPLLSPQGNPQFNNPQFNNPQFNNTNFNGQRVREGAAPQIQVREKQSGGAPVIQGNNGGVKFRLGN